MEIRNMLLTLLAGALTGLVFTKYKVPGGMLIGAIVGATILNLSFDAAYMPSIAKTTAQTAAGAFIGTMVSKEDIQKIKEIYKIGGWIIFSFVVINIGVGLLAYYLSSYDLLTMLMCTIPGGLSDVPLIAADMGAELAPVVSIHFVRAVVGIGIFPSLILWVCRKPEDGGTAEAEAEKAAERAAQKNKPHAKNVLTTCLLSAALGTLGKMSGIPAGALVFSMVGIIAIKLCGIDAVIPRWIKRIAQILSGAYIGCSISMESLLELKSVILPMILILAAYILNMWLVGTFLHKKYHLSRKEAMLMLTPAGAGDMALISSDIGVNSPTLILVQVLRLFVSDAILPQMCYAIAHMVCVR